MVKALPWYKAVRDKLVDPMYAGFFLKFDCNATVGCHVPTDGTPFYHDREQTYHGGNRYSAASAPPRPSPLTPPSLPPFPTSQSC